MSDEEMANVDRGEGQTLTLRHLSVDERRYLFMILEPGVE